jgi:hypothetical protein
MRNYICWIMSFLDHFCHSKHFIEGLCLMGYNAVQSGESQSMFWRDMSPSSWLKS